MSHSFYIFQNDFLIVIFGRICVGAILLILTCRLSICSWSTVLFIHCIRELLSKYNNEFHHESIHRVHQIAHQKWNKFHAEVKKKKQQIVFSLRPLTPQNQFNCKSIHIHHHTKFTRSRYSHRPLLCYLCKLHIMHRGIFSVEIRMVMFPDLNVCNICNAYAVSRCDTHWIDHIYMCVWEMEHRDVDAPEEYKSNFDANAHLWFAIYIWIEIEIYLFVRFAIGYCCCWSCCCCCCCLLNIHIYTYILSYRTYRLCHRHLNGDALTWRYPVVQPIASLVD